MSTSRRRQLQHSALLGVLAVALPVPAGAAADEVYAPNADDGTVSVIDTATNAVVGMPITVGVEPRGITFAPNGTRAYVANGDSDTVSVIDAATRAVTATIAVGGEPRGIAASPDGARVYVANVEDNPFGVDTVSRINTATNTVEPAITVGNEPRGLAISPDSSRVYVTNFDDGTVSVIDTATDTVVDTVTVGAGFAEPRGIAVNPAGTRVFTANSGEGTVSVIDTANNMVVGTPIDVGDEPRGIAFTRDGARAFVTDQAGPDGVVNVIDIAASTVDTITTVSGARPDGIAMTNDGARAYTANTDTNDVSAIATATNAVIGGPIAVGANPRAIAIRPTAAALPPSQSPPPAADPGDDAPPPPGACASDDRRPRLTVRSNQGKRLYRRGAGASVRIRASDANGLRRDPSATRRRIGTRRAGRKVLRIVAVDNCGNRRVVTFAYSVAAPPRIAVAGVSRIGCASARFTAGVRVRSGISLRRVVVRLDGRAIRRTSRKRFGVAIPAGRLDGGSHRIVVAVTDRAGNRSRSARSFNRCSRAVLNFTG